MIYFEHDFKAGGINSGVIKEVNLNCECHETNSSGIWCYRLYDHKISMWTDQYWINLNVFDIRYLKWESSKLVRDFIKQTLREQKLKRTICNR